MLCRWESAPETPAAEDVQMGKQLEAPAGDDVQMGKRH